MLSKGRSLLPRRSRTEEKLHAVQMSLMSATVALIGCMVAAGAQAPNTSNQRTADPSRPGMSTTPGQDTMHLTQDQRNSVMQGLRDQQKQAAPTDFDGQVGSKVPD